ncbi:hypothetical protein J7J00_26470 [Bacillus sp. ISL-4]|uniref:hypothetical protein n=1 Tax=Bacillus sp. ISL-4 TaxID=2819125 RepID=UPI001BEC8092|nr:hypothetical protein [Bacillus sp. ISL-4]MBT2668941.1 hypothetical protein [Bacillus sp. ISL-4]
MEVLDMAICCGECHVELKSDDYVTLDEFSTLRHTYCGYDLIAELTKDIGTYRNIKTKYWFSGERTK